MGDGVSWPAGADEVIKGDLTAAAAYLTPAGGAVVTGVAPCGIGDRDRGVLGYTTSLGFGKKLERIVADPHVALAFHAREHGFSASPAFVLAQGTAVGGPHAVAPAAGGTDPAGGALRGRGQARPGVGPAAARVLRRTGLRGHHRRAHRRLAGPERFRGHAGDRRCLARSRPARSRRRAAATGPRMDVAKAAGQIAARPHRVLAYRGADGFPVVVPVQIAGNDAAGLRLVAAAGLLPPGGRRAGLLAHAYRPQLVGLSTRIFTGWLEVRRGWRRSGVRAAHVQGFRGAAEQEHAAGAERAAGEVRDVAGAAPRRRRAAGTAGRREGRRRRGGEGGQPPAG